MTTNGKQTKTILISITPVARAAAPLRLRLPLSRKANNMIRPVWIVQDADSGLFLCPYQGDVGFTKLLREAGRFVDAESAVETARDFLGNQFHVTKFSRMPMAQCIQINQDGTITALSVPPAQCQHFCSWIPRITPM
jgi:hypothetical protein